MSQAILILGSNLGDRFKYLADAKLLIESYIGSVNLVSSLYETEPWGFIHDNLFLNQALEIETRLNPFEILGEIKRIESTLGRIRGKDRFNARTIDIDILFYEDLVMNTPELTIPHPEMTKRRFVLEPLAEIAAAKMHPVYNKSVCTLLAECQDNCSVKRVDVIPGLSQNP